MGADIVYILKESEENEELRYSLRSVVKNLKFGRIVFVGGKPKNLEPDLHICFRQENDKWNNASNLIKLACESNLTKDIILFNDDFFVLRPVDKIKPYRNKTLEKLCDIVTANGKVESEYIRDRISPAIQELKRKGLTTFNYELHIPMKINRGKMLRIYRIFPNTPAKRSLYGNYWHLWGREISKGTDDGSVQVAGRGIRYEREFVSTTDETWYSLAGKQIREMFPEPCRYEKNNL